MWGWGNNEDGATGNGGPDVPQMVGTDSDWVTAAAGLGHSAAIKSDGTLWMWGANNYGQLGNGTTTTNFGINQVGSDTDWIAVSLGAQHTLALKSDGTIWAWGWDSDGQLGIGGLGDQLTPLRVGTDTDWVKIEAGYFASYGIKNDGTLWAWGRNDSGQLGDGSAMEQSAPVQVGNALWASIEATHHCLAIKADGTLWAWGRNLHGEVGNGTPGTHQLTPYQIGTDNDWRYAATGFYHSCALKGNGTLWSWGDNEFGTLGDGTFAENPTPAQTGEVCEEVFCSIIPSVIPDFLSECTIELAEITPPTTTDLCGDTLTAALYTGTFPISAQGATTIVWQYSNASTFLLVPQDIIIDDQTAPVPTLANLPALVAECAINSIVPPTAQDACAGTITATTGDPTSYDQQGEYTINWQYTDSQGNSASQTQSVRIEDTIAPIVITQDISIDLNGGASITIDPAQINNGSSDNCAIASLELDNSTFTEPGSYTVVLSAIDYAGNSSANTAIVTVIDSTMAFENKEAKLFKIFPNPAQEYLYIEGTDFKINTVKAYTLLGQGIDLPLKAGDRTMVDLSALGAATYIIVIATDHGLFQDILVVK